MNEGGRRGDADVITGRQHLGAVQEDTVHGQVKVAIDGEVHGGAEPTGVAGCFDPRLMTQPGAIGHDQDSGGDDVGSGHRMVAVHPDPLMEPMKTPTLEHAIGVSGRHELLTSERPVEKLGFDDTLGWHRSMAVAGGFVDKSHHRIC